MGIGIRIEDLRKVYDTPPPMAARGAGFSWGGVRTGRKDKKKIEVHALDGISLVIHPGEVFGLLGPNGAGKTTTIAVLTTRVEPTSGRVFVGQHDVWKQQVKAKRRHICRDVTLFDMLRSNGTSHRRHHRYQGMFSR